MAAATDSSRPVLAVDMGGTAWKVAVMSAGRALAFGNVPNRSASSDLEALRLLFDHLLVDAGKTRADCVGIGVALAEIVDSKAKTCPSPCDKHPYFHDQSIETLLHQQIHLPLFVDNDARASLLGEETYGVLSGGDGPPENSLMVTLGTGIGVAARVNGELLRGAHHCGGILGGHVTVDMDGPRCTCGNIGCAEALASGWALAKTMPAQAWFKASSLAELPNPSFQMLCDAVRAGDPHAHEGLGVFRSVWAALLISHIHLLDPQQVVLSGGFTRSADLFLPQLVADVRDRMWEPRALPEFVVADQPELSGVRGAEVLVRRGLHAPLP